MAISSVADIRTLVTMVLGAWLGDQIRFLGKPGAIVAGNHDLTQSHSLREVDWPDVRNLCQQVADWRDQFDDPEMDPSPLPQLAAIALSLGLSDERWNAALPLCNTSRPAIGIPRVVVIQQGIPEVHELRTEFLTHKELASLFGCGRNQVKTKVLDKYPHEQDGTTVRMYVKDMPPAYLRRFLPSSIPEVQMRKEKP